MSQLEAGGADYPAVEALLGHNFGKPELLREALTHSSYSNEKNGLETEAVGDNERLEFLGDAVIGLIVGQLLMERFPGANEGWLSKWRSSLVSRKTLAELAMDLRLGEHLLLGRGERRSGGAEKTSILASGFEALVGAMYLDGGVDPAEKFLARLYERLISGLTVGGREMMDKKTHLQERTQCLYKVIPEYRVIDSWGREHEKTFRVEIWIQGKSIAVAEGRSKKEAEQAAASLALEILEF
jgi:ribonuclease III